MGGTLLAPHFRYLVCSDRCNDRVHSDIVEGATAERCVRTRVPFLVESALVRSREVLSICGFKFRFGSACPRRSDIVVSFSMSAVCKDVRAGRIV